MSVKDSVKFYVEDERRLIIEVDLTAPAVESPTGKSLIVGKRDFVVLEHDNSLCFSVSVLKKPTGVWGKRD